MGKNKPDKLEQKIYLYLLINEYRDADAAHDMILGGVLYRKSNILAGFKTFQLQVLRQTQESC